MLQRKKQQGLSLTVLIILVTVLGVVGLLASKIVPIYIEYYTILKNAKITAQQSPITNPIDQVRDLYSRKTEIDYTTAVPPDEIQITKQDNQYVLSFAYNKEVHLIHNAYLTFKFEASTTGDGSAGFKAGE